MEPVTILASEDSYSNFGWTLHVADLDNDGNEELLIGEPGNIKNILCYPETFN